MLQRREISSHFWGLKWPGREADNLLPSDAEELYCRFPIRATLPLYFGNKTGN
jgi:hypothetical protein